MPNLAAGRIQVDELGGQYRVRAEARDEEPAMELPTGAQGTRGNAGLEDGGVVVVGMGRRGEAGVGAWRWW